MGAGYTVFGDWIVAREGKETGRWYVWSDGDTRAENRIGKLVYRFERVDRLSVGEEVDVEEVRQLGVLGLITRERDTWSLLVCLL